MLVRDNTDQFGSYLSLSCIKASNGATRFRLLV